MRKLLIAILVAASPATGWACTLPIDHSPIEQQIQRAFCAADVVFIGRVTGQLQLGQHVVEHRFQPISAFKGVRAGPNANPKYVLTTGSSCDITYMEGDSYLIFGELDAESGRVRPGKFTVPIGRSGVIREQLASLKVASDICASVESAAPVPEKPSR